MTDLGTIEACDKSALCANVDGGFLCECPLSSSGEQVFSGTGYQNDPCVGINECAEVVPNPCHETAACIDRTEGFECTCLNGFKGSGSPEEGCSDLDECVDGARIAFVLSHVSCAVCCLSYPALRSLLHAALYIVCVCSKS